MSEACLATRDDLYAVKDMAEGPCTCPVAAQVVKSELTLRQFKRLMCKACQAKANLEWLMELSEG